ncbi:MAG: hypothetical protein DME45_02570 [Verrucomicrobia bacterium]|nr:MAG: hypothetical protein DME45_02570 [Verrucomicrobiota bacterium]
MLVGLIRARLPRHNLASPKTLSSSNRALLKIFSTTFVAVEIKPAPKARPVAIRNRSQGACAQSEPFVGRKIKRHIWCPFPRVVARFWLRTGL